MRTLGIVLLSFTPLLFGLDYSATLKKRIKFLFVFKEFILFVKEQIRFSARERNEIITLSLNDPRFNLPLFKIIEKSLKSGENITKIIKENNYIRLNSKEISEIDAFVFGIGKSDIEGQINHCDYYFSVFDSMTQNVSVDISVKSRLSIGLSLGLSVAMFIIMI